MVSRNPFMAFDSFAPAIILNCEILSDGTGAISYESMCGIYITASFQYCAEKVIESFLMERISLSDEILLPPEQLAVERRTAEAARSLQRDGEMP
jgi:hypothetical protein